jgi:hypothetical protein
LCKSFGDERPVSTNPDGSYRRGLFFPGDKELGRFVWVEVEVDPTQTFEKFDFELYLGEGAINRCLSAHNNIQARNTGRDGKETLVFYYKDDTSAETPNIGVRDFTRAGAASMYQRGPILVIREGYRSGPRGWIQECRDLDMRDVRSAADYFSSAFRRGLEDSQLRDVRVLISAMVCAKGVSQHNLRKKWQEVVVNGCDSSSSLKEVGLQIC